MKNNQLENLPDVRDGLTRKERIVLHCLQQLQRERDGRNVPAVMLFGWVLEYVDMSENELQMILQGLSDYDQRPES